MRLEGGSGVRVAGRDSFGWVGGADRVVGWVLNVVLVQGQELPEILGVGNPGTVWGVGVVTAGVFFVIFIGETCGFGYY